MSGTPVIIDGTLSTAAPENLTEIAGNAVVATTAGVQAVDLRANSGANPLSTIPSVSDGISAPVGTLAEGGFSYLFNDTFWERRRNNTQGTLLVSAARTATIASADQTNYNGRGVQVTLNVSVASGTGGLTVTIQGKDPISGTYYALTAAPTAVTATGETIYELYPGIGAASGGVTQRTSGSLPRTWRVNVAVGDTSSYTYSVGFALIV